MKRAFCFMLCILMVLSFTAFSFENSQTGKNFSFFGQDVRISAKEIKKDSELFKVNLQIPFIQGMKDRKIQKEINNSFEKDMKDFKEKIQKSSEEEYERAKKNNFPFRTFQAETSFKVTYNKNNVLSIPVEYYEYTGGAHGFSFIKAANINLSTGNTITLGDIFKENTGYKKIITDEIIRQIKENPEDYFESAFDTVNRFSSEQPFYIYEGGIVIYYGLYDIAPYAAGIREFKLPFTLFGEGVKSEYLVE